MAAVDMGRKEGGCCAPFAGARTAFSIMWLGPRSTSVPSGTLIHAAVLATIDMGRKLGAVPLSERGSWVTHLTQCGQGRGLPACRFTLIRPTVLPQYTNVTDRTDRQRSDSIYGANRFTKGRPKTGETACG